MKTVSISGSLRENVGKKDAKMNRRHGNIPCVLYGGEKQVHFTTNEKSFQKIIYSSEIFLIKINIDGKEHPTILQDVQYHPVSDKILHADFLELIASKPMSVSIPVKLNGSAPGVLNGGILTKNLRKLRVKGMQEDIPESIEINIDELEIGNSVKIRDIQTGNFSFLDNLNLVVVAVRTSRVVVTTEVEEEEEVEEETTEEATEAKEE